MEIRNNEKLLLDQFGEKWFEFLVNDILRTQPFYDLKNNINRLYATGKVLPESKYLFRAFKETDPKNIKVIIIGECPYSTDHANGIAFGTDNKELPTSLKLIFEEVKKTTGNCTNDPSLKEWCKQGVLLINTRLTTRLFEKDHKDHKNIGWQNFILRVIDLIVKYNTVGIIAVGSESKKLLTPVRKRYLIMGKYVAATEHPIDANNENRSWESKNVFNTINNYLENNNMNKIKW